jgi:DNA-directed RNA polymerase subunit H (RpoH/RPB5)
MRFLTVSTSKIISANESSSPMDNHSLHTKQLPDVAFSDPEDVSVEQLK